MKRKAAVDYLAETYKVSERRACGVLSVNRTAYRYEAVMLPDEDKLRRQIIELATNFGRAGYRRITNMINNMKAAEDKVVNKKRVERLWREMGLKVPKKQRKKRRIHGNDCSCIRLRAERPNHVWSYDFVEDRTINGKKVRWLNIIDEGRHMCIASIPRRSWKYNDVIEALADLMITFGTPEYLRSDNGPEFTAKKVKEWLCKAGVITAYIEPGSPWENGYVESFNARMRDEFLNGELFGNMYEVEVLTTRWVRYYNEVRPHSSLNGKAPQMVVYK